MLDFKSITACIGSISIAMLSVDIKSDTLFWISVSVGVSTIVYNVAKTLKIFKK